jgi:hypothetical protein
VAEGANNVPSAELHLGGDPSGRVDRVREREAELAAQLAERVRAGTEVLMETTAESKRFSA